MTPARSWHSATALAAILALALQLVLVVQGGRVLDEQEVPGLLTRLGRLVSYFTIQSNLLVALSTVPLALDPAYDGPRWRVLRLAGVVGITVTGLVHFVLLRPLLDLEGWDRAADTLLHLVVPALAVLGWLLFGPHRRVTQWVATLVLLWPLGWLAWTLAIGGLTGWYPYPFLDVRAEGWASVLGTSIVVTLLVVLLLASVGWYDRRTQRSATTSRRTSSRP